MSFSAYRDQLLAAGFTAITITPTHQVAPGLSSVIVKAAEPDDRPTDEPARKFSAGCIGAGRLLELSSLHGD